jgi:hypothetical protein
MESHIQLDHLKEPKLQFGGYFEHSAAKTGLSEYGPFGKNVAGLHVAQINLGFVGTSGSISMAQEWIDRCGKEIESENIKVTRRRIQDSGHTLFEEEDVERHTIRRLDKIQNRDFIGFNASSEFECGFQTNPRWTRELNQRMLDNVLRKEDEVERIWRIVDLLESEIASISRTDPVPDIIIVSLPEEVTEAAWSAPVKDNYHVDLRRALKARAMRQETPLPIQIILPRTTKGGSDAQGPATRAWNFCTAQYYKAGGIPWRPLSLDEDSCYMGLSFFLAQDSDNDVHMRSSVSMAFDYLGQGLVLRGGKFNWHPEQQGRSPHLTTEAAADIVSRTLEEYVQVQGQPPSRLVIHKKSEFWGSEHQDHNEIDGIFEGVDRVFPHCDIDLVALRSSRIRLFREGDYPPLRGTHFQIGERHGLYTMGFIPHLETYPKPYVPRPWEITQHIGGSAPKELLREILTLTKMNVNNCSYADGTPITLSFSHKIGEILKHVGGGPIQSRYRFYM